MTNSNEIFSVLAECLADKYNYRAVVEFHDEHEGETLLVDFANDDDTDFETDAVCVWSLQKDVERGTDELDYGSFVDYRNAFDFVIKLCNDKSITIYADHF